MANILIADDDSATRDLLKRALESDGHIVATVADGNEAMDHLAGGQAVDLLISDVQMPGIDGLELTRRALALKANLRVLLMSGYAEQLARASTLGSHTVRTLSKPFTLEKARAEVRAALA